MNNYLSWEEKTISDFSEKNINDLYHDGFVFTRKGKGILSQTRSVRINLDKFELSSENKRILRKTEDLLLEIRPIPYLDYTWEIHKLGKEFYETKFGEKTFSAQKIKELITDENKTNFNTLLIYRRNEKPIGYCICYKNKEILHYCYPFYNLDSEISNLGIGMMTKAVSYAKEQGLKYIYLGSAKDSKALYKFQFEGVEWFDGEVWQNDIEKLKIILTN